MSLLMRALEKAAKDRDDARQDAPATAGASAASGTPAKAELTLEPLAAQETPAPQPSAAQPRPGTTREQAQAATVFQASAGPQVSGRGARARRNPLLVLGIIAVMIAIAFAVYVALQILRPSSIVQPSPVAPRGPLPPLTQAPQAAPVVPVPAPLPAASVLPPVGTETKPAVEPAPAVQPTPTPAPRPAPRAAAAAAPEQSQAERNRIVVSRGSPEPTMNPLLPRAYAALQANQLGEAKNLYGQMLRAEPQNIDGLLGLAAIATIEGDSEEATRQYLRILELEPRNALAQTGLIGLLGRADPLAAESRLKSLIAREPAPYLYFTLGNLYADQSLWPAAQQAYFQAFHLEPTNPDYAYNLAIGLEHVGQPKAALGFYRRAAELAGSGEATHFNLAQAQERIGKLASQVE